VSFWTAIVVIVAIVALAVIINGKHRARADRSTDRREREQLAHHENEMLRNEVEELRERVRVLERIATDANSTDGRNARAIADEIESLRGK